MKRFVKTLRLVDTPEAIAGYKKAHAEVWPEIARGIREVGITAMDIYLYGNLAVMIMEVGDDVDVDEAMSRLATLPRQAEWEEYVSQFQQCSPDDTSAAKWQVMEQVFALPELKDIH